jgi:hypothetical protein
LIGIHAKLRKARYLFWSWKMTAKQLVDKWEHGCGFDWSVRQRRDALVLMIEEYAENESQKVLDQYQRIHDDRP